MLPLPLQYGVFLECPEHHHPCLLPGFLTQECEPPPAGEKSLFLVALSLCKPVAPACAHISVKGPPLHPKRWSFLLPEGPVSLSPQSQGRFFFSTSAPVSGSTCVVQRGPQCPGGGEGSPATREGVRCLQNKKAGGNYNHKPKRGGCARGATGREAVRPSGDLPPRLRSDQTAGNCSHTATRPAISG